MTTPLLPMGCPPHGNLFIALSGRAMAMPDIHWGYGFPIGGVAAFDVNEGVVSPGGIGYDINCLAKDSHVLTALGYRLRIADFDDKWQASRLACVNPDHRTTATDIAAYMRFRAYVAYKVRTATGVDITATADHPFLTPGGMVPLKEVGDRPVAVYPFRGVDFEEPPEEVVVAEDDLARFLSPRSFAQVTPSLRTRGLIPLRPRNPKFPYLLKILGLALGDGHASIEPRAAGIAPLGFPVASLAEAPVPSIPFWRGDELSRERVGSRFQPAVPCILRIEAGWLPGVRKSLRRTDSSTRRRLWHPRQGGGGGAPSGAPGRGSVDPG